MGRLWTGSILDPVWQPALHPSLLQGTAVPSAHNGDLHGPEPPKFLTPKPFQHPHCPPRQTLSTSDLSTKHNNKGNRDPPSPSQLRRRRRGRRKERPTSKIPNPPRKSARITLSLLTAHPDSRPSPREYTGRFFPGLNKPALPE